MPLTHPKEGLRITRLMMVLSSMSPLFILWAVRGCPVVSDYWFIVGCLLPIVLPNAFLYYRFDAAKRSDDFEIKTIGVSDDHRDHLLVYLFAMLLPLYAANLSTWREFSSAVVAFVFIVFLFWHLNMHYMNIFFAIFGYRVFTITPIITGNDKHSGKESFVVLTKRALLAKGDNIRLLRLSNTVYFDMEG